MDKLKLTVVYTKEGKSYNATVYYEKGNAKDGIEQVKIGKTAHTSSDEGGKKSMGDHEFTNHVINYAANELKKPITSFKAIECTELEH